MSLREIPCDIYSDFAGRFFKEAGRRFSSEAFAYAYSRFEGITWYIQAVMNRIWESGEDFVERGLVDTAIDSLVGDNELVFNDLLRSQSLGSQMMLRAIAKEGVVSMRTKRVCSTRRASMPRSSLRVLRSIPAANYPTASSAIRCGRPRL